jgi:hypothetical protein
MFVLIPYFIGIGAPIIIGSLLSKSTGKWNEVLYIVDCNFSDSTYT